MADREENSNGSLSGSTDANFAVSAPKVSLPKGGGAISGIGEKFAANPVTGTGSMTVPLFTSPGRSGFGPQLSLSYDFWSWQRSVRVWLELCPFRPSRAERTRAYRNISMPKSLTSSYFPAPKIWFPSLSRVKTGGNVNPLTRPQASLATLYSAIGPGSKACLRASNDGRTRRPASAIGAPSQRTISRRLYGKRDDARIANPADPTRIFTWFICESYDDKGNAILYRYKQEDNTDIDRYMPEGDPNIDRVATQEKSADLTKQFAQRYLKNIQYGNRTPTGSW